MKLVEIFEVKQDVLFVIVEKFRQQYPLAKRVCFTVGL